MSGVAAADDTHLKLEIDGPGVKPETLDPLATLELGRAYFRLLQRIAEEQEVSLELTGLTVEDKCAALSVTPGNFKLAHQTALRADRIVSGGELSSHRLEVAAEDFRAAVRALPVEQSVAVLVGKQRMPVAREPAAKVAPRRSITRLRAMVVTVGAGHQPFARLSSKSELRAFSVKVKDVPTVQLLARHLCEVLDVDVAVDRDAEGLIVRGELLEFTPVSESKNLDEWRAWFASAGGADWSGVEDVEAALGRDDEEPRVDG